MWQRTLARNCFSVSLNGMRINLIHGVLSKSSRTRSRNHFSDSQNGLREFENQLSKFNGNDNDYESKINAARLVALAIQCDENISLNNGYLSERNREMILYNVTGGRYWRFKMCYHTYQTLAPQSMLTNEHLLRAAILGYVMEQYISGGVIFDDVSDRAELRRNKTPWYKKVGSGQAAIDAFLMLKGIFIVMNQIFKHHPGYARCIEILNFSMWISAQGQILDNCISDIFSSDNQQHFNMELFEELAFSKMTVHGFYCPIFLAMAMINYDFEENYDKLMSIINEMGIYTMLENDYCDRYGSKTGKVLDEDIKNGKLTWMILKAKEYANNEQEKILRECYGKGDAKSTQAVIDVYEQINMRKVVDDFKKQSFENICKNVKELPDPRLHDALMYPLSILNKWYHT